MSAQRNLVIEEDVGVLVPLVAGESSRNQRLSQIADFRNAYAVVVQVSTASKFRRKQLVAHGIVHQSGDSLPLVFQRQRHAEYRKSMSEICGSIERVDIPEVIAAGLNPAPFLSHHIMGRPLLANPR